MDSEQQPLFLREFPKLLHATLFYYSVGGGYNMISLQKRSTLHFIN